MRHSPIIAFLEAAVLVPLLVLAPACGRGDRGSAPAAGPPRRRGQDLRGVPAFRRSLPAMARPRDQHVVRQRGAPRDAGFRTLATAEGLSAFPDLPRLSKPRGHQGRPRAGRDHLRRNAGPRTSGSSSSARPGEDYLDRTIEQLKGLVAEGVPTPSASTSSAISSSGRRSLRTAPRTPCPKRAFCPRLPGRLLRTEMGVVFPSSSSRDGRKGRMDPREPRRRLDGMEVPDDRQGRRAPGPGGPRGQAHGQGQPPRRALAA